MYYDLKGADSCLKCLGLGKFERPLQIGQKATGILN